MEELARQRRLLAAGLAIPDGRLFEGENSTILCTRTVAASELKL
jgi:hypothetical protein